MITRFSRWHTLFLLAVIATAFVFYANVSTIPQRFFARNVSDYIAEAEEDFFNKQDAQTKLAEWLKIKNIRPKEFPCPEGYFALAGMTKCEPWIGCEEIENEIETLGVLANNTGRNKLAHKLKTFEVSTYKGYRVAKVSKNKNVKTLCEHYKCFNKSIYWTRELSWTGRSSQFVGECNQEVFITEYLPLGDASNYELYFPKPLSRLRACKSIADVYAMLHTKWRRPLVNQDTEFLERILAQFLIRGEGDLIINDLDFILEHNTQFQCPNMSRVSMELVAPRWKNCELGQARTLRGEDDIWKFPVICKLMLGEYASLEWMKTEDAEALEDLFKRCHNTDLLRLPMFGVISQTIADIIDRYPD